jgi:hypothetical protein
LAIRTRGNALPANDLVTNFDINFATTSEFAFGCAWAAAISRHTAITFVEGIGIRIVAIEALRAAFAQSIPIFIETKTGIVRGAIRGATIKGIFRQTTEGQGDGHGQCRQCHMRKLDAVQPILFPHQIHCNPHNPEFLSFISRSLFE